MMGTQPPASIIAAARASMIKWKVPASVSIAQWADETGWGAHCPGNNCFGIKAMHGQALLTTESIDQKTVQMHQTFAVYPSVEASFDAHGQLLATAPVYAEAMSNLPNVEAFVLLMAAHYATDPTYAAKLMAIIDGSNLTQYDTEAL